MGKDFLDCRTEELPPAADGPLRDEWEFFRSSIVRWLDEGLEGRYVLVKGRELVGHYADEAAALTAGRDRFVRCPFLVKQVRSREPILRRLRGHELPIPEPRTPECRD